MIVTQWQNARRGPRINPASFGYVGTTPTVTRGLWASQGPKSPIFGRCRMCGGLSHHGICVKCGFGSVCASCGVVRQPDGLTWAKVRHDPARVSHGSCHSCHAIQMREAIEWGKRRPN
jgi:hypothetical protein